MIIEHICYSETLDNLVILKHIPTNEYLPTRLTLITEHGEDPVNKESLKELEINLKLKLLELDVLCD